MKIEDTTIAQKFYDLNCGDVFKVEESNSTYVKSKIVLPDAFGNNVVFFKGTNLETGYINDFEYDINVKIVNAKVVIE